MSDIKNRTVEIIAVVLELESQELDNLRCEIGYKTLKKWTSAKHAEIIVAIEDEFGIEVDELSLPRLNNLVKIVDYIQQNKS